MCDDADDPDRKEWSHDGEASFPFFREEYCIPEHVIESVRLLLCRPGICGRDVCNLGKLLFGLSRLPWTTDGLDLSLSLKLFHQDGSMTCQTVELRNSRFELSYGGWIVEGGGDSTYTVVFEMEVGGFRDSQGWYVLSGWLEDFREQAQDPAYRIDISDGAGTDACIDWDQELPDTSAWSRLPPSLEHWP